MVEGSGLPTSVERALGSDSLLDQLLLSRVAVALHRERQRVGDMIEHWVRAAARWAALQLCRASPSQPRSRFARAWERVTADIANWCVLWGWEPSSSGAREDVARLVRGSAEARAVLGNLQLPNVDIATLLGLQRYEVLRPLVRHWLRVNVEAAGPVADRVVQQLVVNGPATIGDEETEHCLAVIPEVASILSQTQAEGLVQVIAALAAAPTDPYRPTLAAAASRVALADLLAVRPELDDSVIPPGSVATDPPVRAALRALGIALRRDEAHRRGRFLAACNNAGLDRDRIVDLAGTASTNRVRGSRRELWAPLPATRRWLRHITATVLAWIVPIVLASGLLRWMVAHPPLYLLDRVTLEVTLASFALIATVHALIITLSREHLPRRMARIAATPRILVSAYVTSMIGIAASAIQLSDQLGLTKAELEAWGAALNGLALGSVLVSVALLAASSFQVLRLSDPVGATAAFGRSSALRLGRAGSRFGLSQARSLELTTLLEALPNVLVSNEAIPGEVAHLVRAGSRGLFLPANRPLRRLVTSPQFESGMSLRVLAPLGEVVSRLDPVLALIPTASQRISRDTMRRGTAVAAVEGIEWLDRSRGVTASLYDLAVRTCRDGDQGGAQRAASVCLDLCFRHLSNMSTARGRAYERGRGRVERRARDSAWRPGLATWQPRDPSTSTESPPASPVVVDLIEACVRSLSSELVAERDVAMYVLKGLLAYGAREDRIPTQVTQALATSTQQNINEHLRLQVLRQCALRGLELNLTDEFLLVVEVMWLPRMGKAENVLDEIAATLAAASRIDAETAEERLPRYLADKRLDKDTRYRALFQIGAAALDAGALRLAVKCIEELCRPSFVAPTQDWLDMEGRLAPSGSFLGNSPRDTLAQFNDLAVGIEPLLSIT
jgi:hypothetical protein